MDTLITCSTCSHKHDAEQCPNCGYVEGQPLDENQLVGQRIIDAFDAFEDLEYE
jgi:hypothetical protein